jgi:hypothetical protein
MVLLTRIVTGIISCHIAVGQSYTNSISDQMTIGTGQLARITSHQHHATPQLRTDCFGFHQVIYT